MQQLKNKQLLFSPSDLVTFLECHHATFSDAKALDEEEIKILEESTTNQLLQKKGLEHEDAYLQQLKDEGKTIAKISSKGDVQERTKKTLDAMKTGVDVIYQAVLFDKPWQGYADFLIKCDTPSKLGNYSYEVLDTKLARRAEPKHIIQLCVYCELLNKQQGLFPATMHLFLGDKEKHSFRVVDFFHYYARVKSRFETTMQNLPKNSYPMPCSYCSFCKWNDDCKSQLEGDDHLILIANITGSQIDKLNKAGIHTVADLANASPNTKVPDLNQDVFMRLHAQAILQNHRTTTGEDKIEILSFPPGKGFSRMPKPDDADLFFDMEGDPLDENGLEYLFGVYYFECTGSESGNDNSSESSSNNGNNGQSNNDIDSSTGNETYSNSENNNGESSNSIDSATGNEAHNNTHSPTSADEGNKNNGKANKQGIFKTFWAHNQREEKETFKRFMTFLDEHLQQHPKAHIYHYNHYETTALKRLACRHAVCEEQLDSLLRGEKFIDLYVVARESLRTSEPDYSIKNLETFYMGKRKGAVASAQDSIVVYNEWRETKDDDLLQEIANYNEEDCISTHLLHKWLIKLKPSDVPWFEKTKTDEQEQPMRKDWEVEYEDYQKRLHATDDDAPALNQRMSHLLEFHNREAKPKWWSAFDRKNKFEEELLDDTECLAGLQLVGSPEPEKRSLVYTYQFPPQDYKLKSGSQAIDVAAMKSSGTIVEIDDEACTIKIKQGIKKDPLPKKFSIGPSGPLSTDIVRKAIYRFVNRLLENPNSSHAAIELLEKNIPRIQGKKQGDCIITSSDLQEEALKVIAALDHSYLFIQGPPGTGKTFTTSHIIVELIKRGKKIGITSNSHKVIHNLLEKIENVALEKEVSFRGIKKSSGRDNESVFKGSLIESEIKTEKMDLQAALFAGTVWTFASEHFDNQLDCLFIEEAGQVATANVLAMANSTKNIILVGDQMQLGQPTQGTHPGDAGLSVLEFLLGNKSTIPPERGIFLSKTYRMRKSICQFTSEAFYDGRLTTDEITAKRQLDLQNTSLPNEGIVMLPITHQGCSQKSVEEGQRLKEHYHTLLGQSFTDKDGTTRSITEKDILVVTPYNVQVNYLHSLLPRGAKIGTIDKFQGQEAPIVLVSMVTSSAQDLPRNIEFLYSKNRLNVAISRAQCLAVVIANPNLLEISCKTIEQMKLVNTFCWLDAYANRDNPHQGITLFAV